MKFSRLSPINIVNVARAAIMAEPEKVLAETNTRYNTGIYLLNTDIEAVLTTSHLTVSIRSNLLLHQQLSGVSVLHPV